MKRYLLVSILLGTLVGPAGLALAEDQPDPDGCRLSQDDPLRGEVNRLMREGDELEREQLSALQGKVLQLGQALGWSKGQEDQYLNDIVIAGLQESWTPTLDLVAQFIAVCEGGSDGMQRRKAVDLFRALYLVQAKQWYELHARIDREIAAVEEQVAKP
jgi:hypothetical protein